MSSEITHILQRAYDAVEASAAKLSASTALAQTLYERIIAMASEHDQIAAIFDEIEPKIAAIIAAKGSSDTANADLLTRAQAMQASIDAAYTAIAPAASDPVAGKAS